ncbi:MAG: EamA/RhaT family transporter [Bacteroidetes bacterium]|nr:MAG: EamA/RhaT family transporter [Bacteroidota bacterium]
MKNNQHLKQLFELVLATLFISTSGALGKFIDMPPPVTVWWRAFLAAIFIYVFIRFKKISLRIDSKRDLVTFILSALFMGIHWITYFYALKFSNVALGMLSLFTYPVITALLEPLFFKVKLNPIHILLGVVVLIGIFVLAPDFDLQSAQVKGVLLGVISALFFSLRLLLLKKYTDKYHGSMLMFYQISIVSVVMLPVIFMMDTSGIQTQFTAVLLLALLTTAIGHTLFLQSLKYFSVGTASIISSIQPIFGIIIAYIFLNEIPTWNTFWGGALILSTVVIESIRSQKSR